MEPTEETHSTVLLTQIWTPEPEKPISFWCHIGWHAWTKWSEPKESKDIFDHHWIEQSRRCTHCNTIQQRRRDEIGRETFW